MNVNGRGIKLCSRYLDNQRIIAKYGLNKQTSVHRIPKDYPELFWHTHQMDLVGPRYIKGDGKFYSVNLMNVTTQLFCKSSTYQIIRGHCTSDSFLLANTWDAGYYKWIMNCALEAVTATRAALAVLSALCSARVAPVFIPVAGLAK